MISQAGTCSLLECAPVAFHWLTNLSIVSASLPAHLGRLNQFISHFQLLISQPGFNEASFLSDVITISKPVIHLLSFFVNTNYCGQIHCCFHTILSLLRTTAVGAVRDYPLLQRQQTMGYKGG